MKDIEKQFNKFQTAIGFTNASLHFKRTRECVIGYVNSDFDEDLDMIRSIRGYTFTVGGCAIS